VARAENTSNNIAQAEAAAAAAAADEYDYQL